MANLDDYLKQPNVTQRGLAARAGVSAGTLSSIRSGHRRPSPRLAKAIEAATDGAVKAAELLGVGGSPPRPPRRLQDGRWVVGLGGAGQASLPAEILADLGVGSGDDLVLDRRPDGWRLVSVQASRRGVQEASAKFRRPGPNPSDDLISERRDESRRRDERDH